MRAGSSKLETGKIALLSAGHFIHDAYPAFLAPLIPLLKLKLGISNTLAGTLATFLRSSSLVQPFLGYWADRTDPRWLVVLAPGARAIFMSLLGASPSYLLMVPSWRWPASATRRTMRLHRPWWRTLAGNG